MKHVKLSANPHWCLEMHGERLIASAGADEIYVVDEAPTPVVQQILEACGDGLAAELQDDLQCGAAVRQLRRLGALIPSEAALATSAKRTSVTWLGEPLPALTIALQAQGWQIMDSSDDAPLVMLVRTNASWAEALAAYQTSTPKQVHVLIDMAYHHTVCIGPMVVPGQTACIACLGHRLMHRWGDLHPPAEPAGLQRATGVAALLADATQLSSRLVERSISLDISQLKLQSSVVFPTPGCPVCEATGAQFMGDAKLSAGKLQLPWM